MRAEENLFFKSSDLDGDVHILARGTGALADVPMSRSGSGGGVGEASGNPHAHAVGAGVHDNPVKPSHILSFKLDQDAVTLEDLTEKEKLGIGMGVPTRLNYAAVMVPKFSATSTEIDAQVGVDEVDPLEEHERKIQAIFDNFKGHPEPYGGNGNLTVSA